MDFALSDEQKLLEQSLRRYLAESVPTTRVREVAATATDANRYALRWARAVTALVSQVPLAGTPRRERSAKRRASRPGASSSRCSTR